MTAHPKPEPTDPVAQAARWATERWPNTSQTAILDEGVRSVLAESYLAGHAAAIEEVLGVVEGYIEAQRDEIAKYREGYKGQEVHFNARQYELDLMRVRLKRRIEELR